jgi:hypothetical protein
MSHSIIGRAMMAGLGATAAVLAAAGLAATANADTTPPLPFDPITSYPGDLFGGSDVNDFFFANPGGTSYTELQITSDFYFTSSGTPVFDFTPTVVTTDGPVPGTEATGFYDDNVFQTFNGNAIDQISTVTGYYDYLDRDNVDTAFLALPTVTGLSTTVTPETNLDAAVLDPSFWDGGGLSSLFADWSALVSDLSSLF